MKQVLLPILILLLLLGLPACGLQTAPAHPTSIPNPIIPAAETQIAVRTQIAAGKTAVAVTATAEQETQQAIAAGTTSAQKTQAEGTTQAQETQTAAANATLDAEAALRATQTAQPMQALVESLAKDGYLNNTEGTYYQIDPFDKSWAQMNWYRWWDTNFSPTNFVIHTHSSWWSASRKADWWASGCGFVFHEVDEANHYFIGLSLDGVVSLHRMMNGVKTRVAHNIYGDVSIPDGSAEITLVVEDGWITFLVNGRTALRAKDTFLSGGALAFSLISGTNKDFGTRCEMKDTELWILK